MLSPHYFLHRLRHSPTPQLMEETHQSGKKKKRKRRGWTTSPQPPLNQRATEDEGEEGCGEEVRGTGRAPQMLSLVISIS